ncbi:hypothetical protein, partial [Holospora elegans]|uniref:hypothetical protein n=1 Tax=Holospora elegans TaxID=431043 RepID=UPI0013922506
MGLVIGKTFQRGKIIFKKLGICALFFVPFLASQCLAEASLQGASFIGKARQEGSIDFFSHKLLHGALSMASAVNFQAINFDHTDIKQALLAASATMVCESASE